MKRYDYDSGTLFDPSVSPFMCEDENGDYVTYTDALTFARRVAKIAYCAGIHCPADEAAPTEMDIDAIIAQAQEG